MGFKIASKGKQSVKDGINAKARDRKGALAAETSLKAKVSVMARNDLSPQLHLEYRSPDQLHPAKRRLRRSNPTHVETVCRSISAMGFCLPVLIAGEGAIIDGHIRWEAACRLGLEAIPCIVIDHLAKNEVRLLAISLNRMAENGEWDLSALQIELADLRALDFDLSLTGFSALEMDILLQDPM